MPRLAVTGHRGLPDPLAKQINAALRTEVARYAHLIGVTCLADGTDTLFAHAVLGVGGVLVVVVPARGYRDSFPSSHHADYDLLIARAEHVIELDYPASTPEAYMAASLRMLDDADRLLAVWDGQPARGHGGTADVVAAARDRGLPVTVVWPAGAVRH